MNAFARVSPSIFCCCSERRRPEATCAGGEYRRQAVAERASQIDSLASGSDGAAICAKRCKHSPMLRKEANSPQDKEGALMSTSSKRLLVSSLEASDSSFTS